MNTTPNVYIEYGIVYTSTRKVLSIKEQRGRRYVYFNGRQINIKSIPEYKQWDLFYWYVLDGLFVEYPCAVIDWWIKIRIYNHITT